jgi:thiol-disulfide isomerase/thioredoxin
MRRRTLLAGLPALAAALAGCTSPPAPTRSTAEGPSGDSRLGTVDTFLGADRQATPTVTGELLDGTAFDLADWRGNVVVINFWGSWCAPCRAESPDLQAAFEATKAQGVQFLGVDIRDGRDAAQAFQAALKITYPSLFDPGGRVALGFKGVPVTVVPATVLLDRQLRVAAIFRKRVTAREIEAAVRAVATEDGA